MARTRRSSRCSSTEGSWTASWPVRRLRTQSPSPRGTAAWTSRRTAGCCPSTPCWLAPTSGSTQPPAGTPWNSTPWTPPLPSARPVAPCASRTWASTRTPAAWPHGTGWQVPSVPRRPTRWPGSWRPETLARTRRCARPAPARVRPSLTAPWTPRTTRRWPSPSCLAARSTRPSGRRSTLPDRTPAPRTWSGPSAFWTRPSCPWPRRAPTRTAPRASSDTSTPPPSACASIARWQTAATWSWCRTPTTQRTRLPPACSRSSDAPRRRRSTPMSWPASRPSPRTPRSPA